MPKIVLRRTADAVRDDLGAKMVLLSGPRQCGKTTLAEALLEEIGGAYFNWDIDRDRRMLKAGTLDEDAHLWVFDEIHKYRQWRNWLKGVFDEHHKNHAILVTGSARLDIYSRGGDSLQGRYLRHRLHPMTWSELTQSPIAKTPSELINQVLGGVDRPVPVDFGALLQLGGFPEPLLKGSDRFAARWRRTYGELLVREDIRSLENVRDLDRLETLWDRLPACVGSLLSINALREDLEVAFETVRSWISIFERTYGVFRVYPVGVTVHGWEEPPLAPTTPQGQSNDA